jgi:hypothetical protein
MGVDGPIERLLDPFALAAASLHSLAYFLACIKKE